MNNVGRKRDSRLGRATTMLIIYAGCHLKSDFPLASGLCGLRHYRQRYGVSADQ